MPSVRTGHFEVHVAQVIFVTQDVAQHRDSGRLVLHQAHGDTGHRRLASRYTPASIIARELPQTDSPWSWSRWIR